VSLRTEQKLMTKKRLLESSMRVFTEKGYSAATIDDITSGAGANRATFYLHFASKDQVMAGLVEQISDEVVASDKPRLAQVVESGERAQIRAWVERRLDQWPLIMPYVTVASQAAANSEAAREAIDSWLSQPVEEIRDGLDRANRFPPESRYSRGVLAFGQVEFYSRRWAALGWGELLNRQAAADALVDSWCHLLCDEGA
jgi:AcrR family transcriptional regulator